MTKAIAILIFSMMAIPATAKMNWYANEHARMNESKFASVYFCPRFQTQIQKDICREFENRFIDKNPQAILLPKHKLVNQDTMTFTAGHHELRLQHVAETNSYSFNGHRIAIADRQVSSLLSDILATFPRKSAWLNFIVPQASAEVGDPLTVELMQTDVSREMLAMMALNVVVGYPNDCNKVLNVVSSCNDFAQRLDVHISAAKLKAQAARSTGTRSTMLFEREELKGLQQLESSIETLKAVLKSNVLPSIAVPDKKQSIYFTCSCAANPTTCSAESSGAQIRKLENQRSSLEDQVKTCITQIEQIKAQDIFKSKGIDVKARLAAIEEGLRATEAPPVAAAGLERQKADAAR